MFVNWTGFDRNNPAHVQRMKLRLESYLMAPDVIAIEACKARGSVLELAHFTPRVLSEHVNKHVQGIESPANRAKIRASVKEFTTRADTSAWLSAINPVDFIQGDLKAIDVGWAAAFDVVDMRGQAQAGYDIPQATSGLTFAKIPEGTRALVYPISGTNLRLNFDTYGGGLGFSRAWFDDAEFYKVDNQALDFKSKEADAKATVMYALITANSTAIAWSTDIAAINLAVSTLITANFGVTPGINDATEFILYSHTSLKSRVLAALQAVQAYTTSKQIVYNIKPVFSPYVPVGYLGWMVAPGKLNKYGIRMDLTLLNEMDITMYAETVVGWTRYNGYVNSVQVNRIAAS